jgi:hypothetical protein
MTGTKFAAREWAEKNADVKNQLSAAEKLEEACWNGLLPEMLPELMEKDQEGKKLFLWHVRSCNSFIEINLSETSPIIESEFSIDPYYFMATKNLS